jgi:hypothetical protein
MSVIPDILYCTSHMRIVGQIIDIILTRFICFLQEGSKNKYVSFTSLHIYLPD